MSEGAGESREMVKEVSVLEERRGVREVLVMGAR